MNEDRLSAEEYLILKQSLDEVTPSEQEPVTYTGNGTAGREADVRPTAFFFQMPKQEPVAWMDEYGDVLSASVVDGSGLRNIPLYTAPPQREWVGLTDAEIDTIGDKVANEKLVGVVPNFRVRFAKAIEAKLREKNGGGRLLRWTNDLTIDQ